MTGAGAPASEPGLRPLAARHRRARIATSAAFAAQGVMLTVLLTHLPQFTDRYRVSEGTVTLVVLMVTLLAGVGSLLSEVLAAATSSRTALRCGLLIIAGAGAAIGLASELAYFVIAFAIYGVGLGAVDAAGNMQGLAVQHRYGRSIITSFHAAWSGGAIVGALWVSGGERLSIPLSGSILPVAGVVLLLLAAAGPQLLPLGESAEQDSELPLGGKGRPQATVPDESTSETAANELPASETTDQKTSLASAFPVTSGPLLLIGLAMVCFWAVDSGISNWSALYLRDVLTAADSTAALGYAAYQSSALASRLVGDLAVRRVGAVVTVRTGALVGTAGALLVVVAPDPVTAIVGFGLTGLGLPMIAPLCFSAAAAVARAGATTDGGPDVAPDVAVDSVVARLNVFNYLGSLLGAALVGGIATATDLRFGFIVPILLAVTVFILARAFAPAEQP